MHVRTAGREDAQGLASCIVPAWLQAHRGQIPDHLWDLRSADWTVDVSAEAWRRTLDDAAADPRRRSHVLVADEATTIVGLVAGAVDDERCGKIDALYVLPGHQHRGLGRALLAASLDTLRNAGATQARIVVLAANTPAQGFYERVGGHRIESTHVHEADEVLPAVVYQWLLEP